jgi:hypothetical protein
MLTSSHDASSAPDAPLVDGDELILFPVTATRSAVEVVLRAHGLATPMPQYIVRGANVPRVSLSITDELGVQVAAIDDVEVYMMPRDEATAISDVLEVAVTSKLTPQPVRLEVSVTEGDQMCPERTPRQVSHTLDLTLVAAATP